MRPRRSYGFEERLSFSEGRAPDADSVFPFLQELIPGFKGVRKAPKVNDRTGCDYYVERHGLYSLSFDLKRRGKDWSVKGYDDLALETFSVVERGIVGWTRDPSKASDYILWFWQDTGRYFILPFPPLCAVFQKYWKEWRAQYRVQVQRTHERSPWHSECVYVPRLVVANAIYRWGSGYQSIELKENHGQQAAI